jgi:hypothetical protein
MPELSRTIVPGSGVVDVVIETVPRVSPVSPGDMVMPASPSVNQLFDQLPRKLKEKSHCQSKQGKNGLSQIMFCPKMLPPVITPVMLMV